MYVWTGGCEENVYGIGFETRRTWLIVKPTMELLNPIKVFLTIALIRISPSVGDGNGDLSTVSESFGSVESTNKSTPVLQSRDCKLDQLFNLIVYLEFSVRHFSFIT